MALKPTATESSLPDPQRSGNPWDAAELAQGVSAEQAEQALRGSGGRATKPLPPVDSDYLDLFDDLPDDLQALRRRVREFMEREVAPSADAYWERAEFPHEIIPKMRDLGLMEGLYDEEGTGQSMIDGLVSMEMARVDPSIATFYGVQGGLAMGSIFLCGSPEQREEWLPRMRRFEIIGGFGLTEPDVGSGASRGLLTTCRREGDEWVLNGRKRWIGNSTFGQIVVIWARDEADDQVKGFVVRTDSPGYSVTKMEGKIAQRSLQNGEITLESVRVAERDRLQNARSFKDTARVLTAARAGVAWQAVGCAMGAYEKALSYAQERTQFGRPIARFQLIQQMLVGMLGNIISMQTLVLRVSRMQDAGKMRDEHAALAKQWCAARCREVVQQARELMGGNGILLEYGVARLFADAEAIYSYEGSNEINTLIVGRAITGFGAFV